MNMIFNLNNKIFMHYEHSFSHFFDFSINYIEIGHFAVDERDYKKFITLINEDFNKTSMFFYGKGSHSYSFGKYNPISFEELIPIKNEIINAISKIEKLKILL